jgi:hypothetical protein
MTNPIETFLIELDYPSQLLEAANDMIVRSRYEISVVTAQMACEICTERVFRAFFALKNVAFLEDSVDDLLPSYNLANDKVRKVYFALSNDPINQQFFWSEYKVVVSLRNKAVHAGARLQESQAQMVLRVAKLVVRHLQSVERSALKQIVSIPENIANTTSS